MDVLLATGIEELDKQISDKIFYEDDINIKEPCYYREGVLDLVHEQEYHVVVLSAELPGDIDIVKLIRELRMYNIRIILLPGSKSDTKVVELAREAVALGVYDIIWDPIRPNSIVDKIKKPSSLKDVDVEPKEEAIRELVNVSYPEPRPSPKQGILDKLKKGLYRKNDNFDLAQSNDLIVNQIDEKQQLHKILEQEKSEEFVHEIGPYKESIEPFSVPPDKPVKETVTVMEKENKETENSKILLATGLRSSTKVIAVAGLWNALDVSEFTALLAQSLVRNSSAGKVAVVDCNLAIRALGLRMGISAVQVENHDWRRNEIPVPSPEGVLIYPLSPSIQQEPSVERLRKILDDAVLNIEWLIMDVGCPGTWWFEKGVSFANLVMWPFKSDQVFLEQARLSWRQRPLLQCKEIAILSGEGEIEEIERGFVLPCIQVKSIKDKKGIRNLIKMLNSMTLEKGRRVLTVGFKSVPQIPGLIIYHFINENEALAWIKGNKPECAVLLKTLRKVSLLEYDLKKKNVEVYKTGDEFLEVILKNLVN